MLQRKVDDGTIRQVTGNDYKTAMASGEVIAAIAWSGDMLNDRDTYGFNIPESGGTLWTDNLLIPILASHKKNAESWMNFYYQPDVAATVAAYVNYISPVAGAQEAMAAIDPTQVDNPAIFPDQATLSRVQVFMPLNDTQQASYSTKFAALSGA
jgi:spermidine/putrescine transport system substrate-binding protein